MNEKWDAVVIGAGVGGVTVAALLAKSGRKTLLVEKEDRVGGRSLSFMGSELKERGVKWYKELLAGQYCYLADADPPIEEIAQKGLLDGYILDLGYHGVSCAGEGYFGQLRDILGGYDVNILPCLTGCWIDGVFYKEFPMNTTKLDDKLYAEFKKIGRKYFDFFGDLISDSGADFASLDKVSLHDHLVSKSFSDSKVVYDYWRCLGTLITTINNPNDISVGDIIRYSAQTIAPIILSGKTAYVGGFTEGGIIKWSEAIESIFKSKGGETLLETSLSEIAIEDDGVKGVTVKSKDGELKTISAKEVVFTIPIQELFEYADENRFPKAFAQRVKSLYGYGSVAPYIGLNELPIPEDEANRLVKTPCVVRKEEGFDWDVYMAWNIQSAVEPSCAPEGKHLFTAYLPVTEQESKDRSLIMKIVKAVPEFMDRVYPGFKKAIDWELYPVCRKLEGVAKSVTQAGSLKPDVEAPDVKGLYFAGDTARGYGVAMDCACASGMLCAQRITGENYGLPEK